MDYEAININAAEDAIRLIGGDQLVSAVTSIYEAIHRAELRGQQDGFDEGHAIGLIDGRAAVEREIGVLVWDEEQPGKVNAWVEGADISAILDEQPSDEGLAGLAETF